MLELENETGDFRVTCESFPSTDTNLEEKRGFKKL
jgi:hypothetical protein